MTKRVSISLDGEQSKLLHSVRGFGNKEAEKVKVEYNQYASTASSYMRSGLSESEAVELLIVDGLDRDAANSYITMAKDIGDVNIVNEEEQEFSFVFEDSYGNVFTSHDIDKTIVASSEPEAFKKACALIGDDNQYEIRSIISIEKK